MGSATAGDGLMTPQAIRKIPEFTDAIAGYRRNLMISVFYPVRAPD